MCQETAVSIDLHLLQPQICFQPMSSWLQQTLLLEGTHSSSGHPHVRLQAVHWPPLCESSRGSAGHQCLCDGMGSLERRTIGAEAPGPAQQKGKLWEGSQSLTAHGSAHTAPRGFIATSTTCLWFGPVQSDCAVTGKGKGRASPALLRKPPLIEFTELVGSGFASFVRTSLGAENKGTTRSLRVERLTKPHFPLPVLQCSCSLRNQSLPTPAGGQQLTHSTHCTQPRSHAVSPEPPGGTHSLFLPGLALQEGTLAPVLLYVVTDNRENLGMQTCALQPS